MQRLLTKRYICLVRRNSKNQELKLEYDHGFFHFRLHAFTREDLVAFKSNPGFKK